MPNPIFKRCSCTGPALGPDGHAQTNPDGRPKTRRLGSSCPKLKNSNGTGWNPKHGKWYFQLQITPAPGEPRVLLAQGGLAGDFAHGRLDC